MKGIKIIYKPLLALKPIHIALLGVSEQPCHTAKLCEQLPLPDVVLAHFLEELIFWRLMKREGQTIERTSKGKTCLTVWSATQSKGYWEFDDDGTWLLGEGTFQFANTLANLDSVGLDTETGETLNDSAALKSIRDQQTLRANSESYANSGKCVAELKAGVLEGKPIEHVVETIVNHTNVILHLNRVCDQLSASVPLFTTAKKDHLGSVARERNDDGEFLKVISSKKRERIRQIQRQQGEGQRAIWIVLAQWFRRKDGLLGKLARECPGAFRCVSTVGVPLWDQETEQPAFLRGDDSQPELANANDSFLSWIGDAVSS